MSQNTPLFTYLNTTLPDNISKLAATKTKTQDIIKYCHNLYQNQEKEGSYLKTEQYVDSVFTNVIYWVQQTSTNILDMLDTQNKEIDKVNLDVNSVSSKLKQLRTIAGVEELLKFNTPKPTLRTKKMKKVKIENTNTEKYIEGHIQWDKYDRIGVPIANTELKGGDSFIKLDSKNIESIDDPPSLDIEDTDDNSQSFMRIPHSSVIHKGSSFNEPPSLDVPSHHEPPSLDVPSYDNEPSLDGPPSMDLPQSSPPVPVRKTNSQPVKQAPPTLPKPTPVAPKTVSTPIPKPVSTPTPPTKPVSTPTPPTKPVSTPTPIKKPGPPPSGGKPGPPPPPPPPGKSGPPPPPPQSKKDTKVESSGGGDLASQLANRKLNKVKSEDQKLSDAPKIEKEGEKPPPTSGGGGGGDMMQMMMAKRQQLLKKTDVKVEEVKEEKVAPPQNKPPPPTVKPTPPDSKPTPPETKPSPPGNKPVPTVKPLAPSVKPTPPTVKPTPPETKVVAPPKKPLPPPTGKGGKPGPPPPPPPPGPPPPSIKKAPPTKGGDLASQLANRKLNKVKSEDQKMSDAPKLTK